jgi:hypothetical protein
MTRVGDPGEIPPSGPTYPGVPFSRNRCCPQAEGGRKRRDRKGKQDRRKRTAWRVFAKFPSKEVLEPQKKGGMGKGAFGI